MDRRAFFQQAFRNTGEKIVKLCDAKVTRQATHWIRPPYAQDELAFLLACTRCGACIAACPHEVIFPLAARLGITVAGTPAMDLLHKGCHLCEAWPCVAACEPGALKQHARGADTKDAPSALPRPFARVTIDTHACLPHQGPECGACEGSCPIPGALVWDMYRPRIDPEHCVGCALCRAACIAQPSAIKIEAMVGAMEVS
ncbi:MAG: 4Fe-4S binding protein [Burkholderiaceae bacterium]|jgi:ferredoxin-type protein NapG|nr:4Fe-4S binding protein [Burkholderiaceae bacterium]